MLKNIHRNVNLTFIYGSNEINHTRKRDRYTINFFHAINSPHRGRPRKPRGCSQEVQSVIKNNSSRYIYVT